MEFNERSIRQDGLFYFPRFVESIGTNTQIVAILLKIGGKRCNKLK